MGHASSKQAIAIEPWNDMRAHRRVRLNLHGKIFSPDEQYEDACLVLNLSPDGARLKSVCSTKLGSNIVLYVEGLGRYEGTIIRKDRLNVGVRFSYSKRTRTRIAERIMDYLTHGTSIPTPTCDSGRLPVTGIEQNFTQESGQVHACEIVDITINGISLKAAVRPAIGELVLIGKTATVVARHTDVGFEVTFSNLRESK